MLDMENKDDITKSLPWRNKSSRIKQPEKQNLVQGVLTLLRDT